jgi:Tfp pilus assembly pilus retraction ATPase PilT
MKLTKMCVFHIMIFTVSIREIIKTSKTSTLLDDIEQCLTNIKYNIDNVVKNREQNLEKIRQQRQIFHDQVKQMHDLCSDDRFLKYMMAIFDNFL